MAMRPAPPGMALVRWAGPPVTTVGDLQDSWLRSRQLPDDDARSLRVLTGLTGWQVYFFTNAWANCQSTGDAAASPASPASGVVPPRVALPKGVRVVFSFAPESGLTGDLTRDSLLGP